MNKKADPNNKTVAENRKARFAYEVVDTVEAGLVLTGTEVKSLRVGKATIASLNRGATYYARKIAINMERTYRLPKTGRFGRYVIVDSGAAEVYLFVGDRWVDVVIFSILVIVLVFRPTGLLGERVSVSEYRYAAEHIWGATATILGLLSRALGYQENKQL